MRYWYCRCGKSSFCGSMPPKPCAGCSSCGSDFFGNDTPAPHEYHPKFDPDTGERLKDRYSRCYKEEP